MGKLSSKQLSLLSDKELTQYIEQSKEIEYTKVYKANPNIIMREVDGDCLLIPTSNDIAINGLITLNPIAQFLWQQFQTPSTIPEVLAKAKEKYDDEEGCMEQEIRCFVNDYIGINFMMEK
ncbi:PqqD family protein [Phocaeicola coprocola]